MIKRTGAKIAAASKPGNRVIIALGRNRLPGLDSTHPVMREGQGDMKRYRALRKVIRMLATTGGEFSESEVWLFSAETLSLATALAVC